MVISLQNDFLITNFKMINIREKYDKVNLLKHFRRMYKIIKHLLKINNDRIKKINTSLIF